MDSRNWDDVGSRAPSCRVIHYPSSCNPTIGPLPISWIEKLAGSTLARKAYTAFTLHASGAALAYILHVVLARWLGAGEYGRSLT